MGRAQQHVTMRNFFAIVINLDLAKFKDCLFIFLEKNGKILGLGYFCFPVTEIGFLKMLSIGNLEFVPLTVGSETDHKYLQHL